MKNVEAGSTPILYLYWFTEEAFNRAKEALIKEGVEVVSSKLTPCQVMRASGNKVVYATPEVWSRICVRQGSWYRNSKRFGQYMMMSERKLPGAFDEYFDAEITKTDFMPENLPSTAELLNLVDSEAYQTNHKSGKQKELRMQLCLKFSSLLPGSGVGTTTLRNIG